MQFSVLTVLLVCSLTSAGKLSRNRLVRVNPATQEQADGLERLRAATRGQLDFWGERGSTAGRPQLVRVPPEHLNRFRQAMADLHLSWNVTVPDIEKEILRQREQDVNPDLFDLNLEQYNRHDVIDRWLDTIAQTCGSRCSVFNTGMSFERRPMRGIRITGTAGTATQNILVEGGMHSDEWISISTVVWLINTWVTGYEGDQHLRQVIDAYNWYFLPCGNPDGYEFSHSHGDPQFRLWRKNRRPFPGNDCNGFPELAFGSDLNRNYDFMWGTGETSPNPCDPTYRGPHPFSEPESQNSADFIRGVSNMVGYYSLHSFGQLILHPYFYTSADSPDRAAQQQLGDVGRRAILATNPQRGYDVGAPANVGLYNTGGSSVDWAYNDRRMQHAYAIELPDLGDYGKILPAAFIRPVGEETSSMLVAMALGYVPGP